MATITVTIDLDNAAFDDEPATEVGRILRQLATNVEEGDIPPFDLADLNGNKVGEITDDAERGR